MKITLMKINMFHLRKLFLSQDTHLKKQLIQQIELINKLKDSFPNIELHMYGFGKEEQHLKERIQKLGLEKHVILRGFKRFN